MGNRGNRAPVTRGQVGRMETMSRLNAYSKYTRAEVRELLTWLIAGVVGKDIDSAAAWVEAYPSDMLQILLENEYRL